ncbi:hypothetical protein QJS66_09960 [Kocuria rhizophila]|nr:hypothetical protein QJS66_09960 [Kocuria rhizophila]
MHEAGPACASSDYRPAGDQGAGREIAETKTAKEAAIEGQDYEKAAPPRDTSRS